MSCGWVLLLAIAALISGCASTELSPGATLVAGLAQYQGEMQRLAGSPGGWPERQRAGVALKTTITATVGASAEFYRLVDLDIRRREFLIAMRETPLSVERRKEMSDELAQMNDEIAALKPVIRTQLAALRLQSDPDLPVEDAAIRGLISLALDAISSNGARGFVTPSTKVGQFVVTDMGSFSVVRAPDGRTYRCLILGFPEEGAAIKCDPVEAR